MMKPITTHELARRRAGKSKKGIGDELGVDRSYVSRIEAMEVPASERYRRGFARACGVAANEVFDPVTHRVLEAEAFSSEDDAPEDGAT